MTTERLQEFIILANTLNYSKAADILFISQSVLSKHIKEMETELGAKLFLRDTHSVYLTDEGKMLLHEIPSVMKQADLINTLLSQTVHKADGRLTIYCHEQTLCEYILSYIGSFRNNYNNIDLDVHIIESANDISAIQDADILLSPCDFINKLGNRFIGKLIYTQSAHLAIPPYHHLGDAQSIALKELSDENILVPFADELFGPYAINFFLAAKKGIGQIKKTPVINATDALLKVELGEGVMIIPHHLKQHLYPRPRTLVITDPECVFPIYIYAKEDFENTAARLFYDGFIQ